MNATDVQQNEAAGGLMGTSTDNYLYDLRPMISSGFDTLLTNDGLNPSQIMPVNNLLICV